ncbi:ATP-binding cassette domain-containing protein [Metabacillus mangrovi]
MRKMTKSGQLAIRHLEKSYGDKPVLEGINLELNSGEFVAIVGKSGCGKSTLLKLAGGLEKPGSGEILVGSKPLKGLNTSARIMFQDGRLFPWKKVIDNVGIGLKGNWRELASETLKQVGLADRSEEWPSVLSGGQRQRVALARALVNEPDILLLDEPLGALDALTRIEMQRLIEKLWKERRFTALLVTHDVDEAVALADRVVLIDNGKIVMDKVIPIPRPRQRDHAKFAALSGEILRKVMGEESIHSIKALGGER